MVATEVQHPDEVLLVAESWLTSGPHAGDVLASWLGLDSEGKGRGRGEGGGGDGHGSGVYP